MDTNRTINFGTVTEERSLFLLLAGGLADQAENDTEGTINIVEFVAGQLTMRLTEAAGVKGANLLDQDKSSGAFDLYLRPEGGGKGVSLGIRGPCG